MVWETINNGVYWKFVSTCVDVKIIDESTGFVKNSSREPNNAR